MIVRIVINGLGHMGMPGLLAIQQISESLRHRHIDLSIAGLIDVDPTLREKVEFFTRHLSPSPSIIFAIPEERKTLYEIMQARLELQDYGEAYLVYDASPTQFHFPNLKSCLAHPRVTFLAEKPMVADRAELEQLEERTANDHLAIHPTGNRMLCDLIETQSAVCLHLQDLVSSGDLEIDKLSFFSLE